MFAAIQATRGVPVGRMLHVLCPRAVDAEKTTQESVRRPLNGPSAACSSTSHAMFPEGVRKPLPPSVGSAPEIWTTRSAAAAVAAPATNANATTSVTMRAIVPGILPTRRWRDHPRPAHAQGTFPHAGAAGYPPTSRPPPVTRRASAAKPPPSSHGARNSHTAMFAASRVVGPGRASQIANQNAPHTAEPARRGFHPRLRSVIQPVTAPASGATIVRSGTRSHTHSTASKSVTGSKGLARFHVARAPYLGL